MVILRLFGLVGMPLFSKRSPLAQKVKLQINQRANGGVRESKILRNA